MSIIKGTETIVNPLQTSALNKKGLCDYVVNVASGCLHGCSFCYVPSTPAIRTKQTQLHQKGVSDPQMDWGQYLFVRENIPEKLEQFLSRKKTWRETPEGKGVVLLCSGTDPYQNKQTATVTRSAVQVLLKYNKRVRILTRGLSWINDLDVLNNENVIVGMSLPYLDDELSRKIEPQAPPPSKRYRALQEGHKAGCRLYVAMAPTPPTMTLEHFRTDLEQIMYLNPEVIFWEPINARGTNGKRMLAAGLEFTSSIMSKQSWVETFVRQWEDIETAAKELGCLERLHIWPDPELRGYIDQAQLDKWLYQPTVEKWKTQTDKKVKTQVAKATLRKRGKTTAIL
ncbi:MAG: radical SAM protein [Symploca sp. SIO2D2]|nr:radical SAM protein [Symploca sp. SIO2D2]